MPATDASAVTPAAAADSPPAHASVAAPARASKGTVVLAIGLPGSGKSSWFKRHNIHPLSSDLLRNILFDDVEEQRYQGLVFSTLRSLLRARLIAVLGVSKALADHLARHPADSAVLRGRDADHRPVTGQQLYVFALPDSD